MKKISCVIILILSFGGIKAQDTAKKWTLEECIQYAIEHNINIKQRNLQKENADTELQTAKMSRLPDLNAGINQNWGFGKSLNTNTNGYENRTNSNSSFYISSNMPLFTGFRIQNQIKQNELELEIATQGLEKAKEDLSLNIAALFLDVLFNKEILKVNEEQLKLSNDQVKRTEYLVEVGKVPSSQLYDIKAQAAKDEVSVIQALNRLQLSLLDLSQSLELERASTSFDIFTPDFEGNVIENNMQSILPPDMIYDNAITFKPQIKEQELKVESSKKSLKIAQAGYMPTLSLGLGYSNNFFHSYDTQNIPFKDQINNNGGESIGLSLSIPIFNRFSVKNQVKSARINIQNQQLVLDNVKKSIFKEIQTAYLNATAAQAKYSSSIKAVEASQESFKYAEERYEIGKLSVFEYNEAKTKLIQSLSEQIQAKYDFIFRSKILDFYNGLPIKL